MNIFKVFPPLIFTFCMVNTVSYFDFGGNHESSQPSYAVLGKDPNKDLSPQFSICSSIFITFFKNPAFFQISRDNGKNWIQLTLNSQDLRTQTYSVSFIYNNMESILTFAGNISIRPRAWSHCCLSLDLEAKKLGLMVNGISLFDGKLDIKRKISEDKIKNLEGKLEIGSLQKLLTTERVQSELFCSNLNVYSKILNSTEMIEKTNGANCSDPGDYLAWSQMSWTRSEKVEIQEAGDICKVNDVHNVIFPADFKFWKECMDFCPKVALGRSSLVKTRSENKWSDKIPLWGPYSDEETEGQFVDYYDDDTLPHDMFGPGQPNGGTSQNCVISMGGAYYDIGCSSLDTDHYGCSCQYQDLPIVKLRGLCQASYLDTYYIVKNQHQSGKLVFYGLERSRIEFNDESLQWIATTQENQMEAIGQTEALKESFALGKHSWTINNDSKGCNRGKPYTKTLKLTGCLEDEFTCDDGQCIGIENRCNQVLNCMDGSDETNCQILTVQASYEKSIPPISVRGNEIVPVKINVSIVLLNVLNINEVGNEIQIQFTIIMQWKETRAIYQNLKKKTNLNSLNAADIERIWKPYIIYKNTDNYESTATKSLLNNVYTTLTISRQGNFTRSGNEVADEVEYFKGNENMITMNQTYAKIFQCKYKLVFFPFDTQVTFNLKGELQSKMIFKGVKEGDKSKK
jgi:hypothetical protein